MRWVHPQDRVPLRKLPILTLVSFPQSHRHFQMTVPAPVRSAVGSTAVSLPNFCPLISTNPPDKHPQDLVPSRNRRLELLTRTSFPHSHRHFHTTALPRRSVVGSMAISFPNFCPLISIADTFLKHPQDVVNPLDRLCPLASVSLPQSHRQRQTTALLPRRSAAGSMAVRFPNLCPDKSLIFI